MEQPNERLKRLRKNELNLSQEAFAKQINLSRSNLGNIETKKINLTDRVIADICRAFHVNREWLEKGTEPIFVKFPPEEGADSLDDEIEKLYVKLSDKNKQYLCGYIHRLLEEQKKTDSNS